MLGSTTKRAVSTLVFGLALGLAVTLAGCDDGYVAAGDFYTPTVEPMDFSPYGYDYSVYDVLTGE